MPPPGQLAAPKHASAGLEEMRRLAKSVVRRRKGLKSQDWKRFIPPPMVGQCLLKLKISLRVTKGKYFLKSAVKAG
jgi:hypothetical protein